MDTGFTRDTHTHTGATSPHGDYAPPQATSAVGAPTAPTASVPDHVESDRVDLNRIDHGDADTHLSQPGYGAPSFAASPAFDDMAVARALYRPDSGGYRWVGAGVAAVALVAGAAVVISAGGSDSAADDTPGMVSALTPSMHPRADEQEEPVISAAALVPGYRAVVAPDSDAAYDVPADWTIASPGYSGGFGTSPDTIGGKGYASEGKDYCPGSTRTVSFLTGSPDTDATAAALDTATRTARIAYAIEAVPAATEPLRSLDGGQNGAFVEARGRIDNPAPGCAPEFSVYTFATSADTGSLVMVIAADTGVPNAVDPAAARRIFASIRPYKP